MDIIQQVQILSSEFLYCNYSDSLQLIIVDLNCITFIPKPHPHLSFHHLN